MEQKLIFINFYLWLGKTPWLRLSKLGVLRVLRLRVLVLGLGVQWGGVGWGGGGYVLCVMSPK